MLDELLAQLRARDLEDDAWPRLESASWQEGDLILELVVLTYYATTKTSRWRVHCSEVADFRLSGSTGDISFHNFGHVAARQQTEPTCTLMFRKRPSSVPECLGKLWLAHERVGGHWVGFDRYWNSAMPLASLLEAGNGVLATGPKFLVEAYADALAGLGMGEYLTDERPSRFGEDTRLGTFILGQAFVVAKDFTASRIDL